MNKNKKAEKVYAYVGTWASDLHDEQNSENSSGGIHVFLLEQDGQLTHLSNVSEDVNAGILCISSDQRYLYSVNERKNLGGIRGNGGGVCSYAIEPETGLLQYINSTQSMGAYPCYISIDGTGSYVFVCNHGHHMDVVTRVIKKNGGKYTVKPQYDDGNVVMFPVREDGGLGDACDVKLLTGSSVDPFFQASAHPHSVNVDLTDKFVIACDKGTDRIVLYKINFGEGKLMPNVPPYVTTSRGTGPRHLAFHPSLPYLFINNETNSSVSSYLFDTKTGDLVFVNNLPTIPSDYVPEDPSDQFAANHPADIQIHPNGKFVCISNRGHNSIATYKIDVETAKLTLIDYTPTQGAIPRAISFDPSGRFLFVANQRSGSIVSFLIDAEKGNLKPTGATTYISNPVCIKFVKFSGE